MSIFSKVLHPLPAPLDFSDAFESIERLKQMAEELTTKEREIMRHEKMILNATDGIEIAIWGKDVGGRFVFLNSICAERILRVNIQDVASMTDDDFEHDALASPCMQSDKIVIETERTHRFIECSAYDDGSVLFVDTTKSPWFINGELVGTVGFGKVITELVPIEVKSQIIKPSSFEIPVDSLYNASDIKYLIEP